MVKTLLRRLGERLEAVVLFGSRARGEAHPESDWDILLIVKDLPRSPLARQRLLLEALPPALSASFEFLVLAPEEWYGHVSPLVLDVALDGRVLYDGSGKMKEYLKRIRERVRELGLVRVKSDGSHLWLWEKGPPRDWQRAFEGTAP